MNVKYINPLLESTISVLSTMAMVEATPGKPTLKDDNNTLGDITGMINLSKGGQVKGSLAISFSSAVVFDIAEKMLGETTDTLDSAMVDMVGELTNMITGSAKRLYCEQGLDFDLTLPHTTVGNDLPTQHSVAGKPIVLPFTTNAGNFYVEICFPPAKAAKAS